jgi:putative hydrolase of the HAD superfamily
MFKAVFFDWGHTLFDTASSVDFIVQWAADHGCPLARDEVAELWESARVASRSAEELALGRDKSMEIHHKSWTRLWGPIDELCPGAAQALYHHETSAEGWVPFLDTESVLAELERRKVPVVIVSDVPFDLRPIFAHYGLEHYVHTFVLSGEHGTIKPERRLFQIALDAVDLAPRDVLMVGDNQVNDGVAIDAGITTLLLPQVASGCPRGLSTVLDLFPG